MQQALSPCSSASSAKFVHSGSVAMSVTQTGFFKNVAAATRAHAKNDLDPIDRLIVGRGQTGTRPMPEMNAVVFEEENRTQDSGARLLLDHSHQRLERLGKWSALRDQTQNPCLLGLLGFRLIPRRYVNHHPGEPDGPAGRIAFHLPARRHPERGAVRPNNAIIRFVAAALALKRFRHRGLDPRAILGMDGAEIMLDRSTRRVLRSEGEKAREILVRVHPVVLNIPGPRGELRTVHGRFQARVRFSQRFIDLLAIKTARRRVRARAGIDRLLLRKWPILGSFPARRSHRAGSVTCHALRFFPRTLASHGNSDCPLRGGCESNEKIAGAAGSGVRILCRSSRPASGLAAVPDRSREACPNKRPAEVANGVPALKRMCGPAIADTGSLRGRAPTACVARFWKRSTKIRSLIGTCLQINSRESCKACRRVPARPFSSATPASKLSDVPMRLKPTTARGVKWLRWTRSAPV